MDVARRVAASMRLHDGGRAFSALAAACRNRDNWRDQRRLSAAEQEELIRESTLLTAARNEQLTRVGPGTPMGELLRRYWTPFAGASELDYNPIKAVRLLGEDLVLYRDLTGRYGLVDRHCPHRRADLSYGWVEENGIRCSYHGWLMTRPAVPRTALRRHGEPQAVEGRLQDRGLSGARARRPAVGLHGPAAGARAAGVGAVHLGATASARSCSPTSRAISSSARRTRSIRCTSNGCTTTGASSSRARTAIAPKHLKIKFEEFEHGFIYKRVREGQSEEDRYWTVGRVALWPIGFFLGSHFEWRVPVDDENTLSVAWFFVRVPKEREPYVQESVPTWVSPIKDERGRWISATSSTRTSSPGSAKARSPTAPRRTCARATSASR